MVWLVRALIALCAPIAAILAILAFPQPLFAHHVRDGNIEVWSDRPIDPAVYRVLADTRARLARSELYDPAQRFRIFLCNSDWRMAIYSQRLNPRLGGVADTWLTHNVYVRRSDLASNRLIPATARVWPMGDRPLSYYLAHEITHILEARAFGLERVLNNAPWVWEGYADYIGKGEGADLAAWRRDMATGERAMDPARSGLYRRHHLRVAYMLERRGVALADLMRNPPDPAEVDAAILRDTGWLSAPSAPAPAHR